MGGSDVLQSYLMEAADWQRIEADDVARTGPFILGIDLGTSSAMSAAAGYWPATGRLESIACFPEEPGLAERGLADGVGPLVCRTLARQVGANSPWKEGVRHPGVACRGPFAGGVILSLSLVTAGERLN